MPRSLAADLAILGPSWGYLGTCCGFFEADIESFLVVSGPHWRASHSVATGVLDHICSNMPVSVFSSMHEVCFQTRSWFIHGHIKLNLSISASVVFHEADIWPFLTIL